MTDFETAKEKILDFLEENLPEHLSYHSVDHTLDVYAVSMDLAKHEGLSAEDKHILGTAALLHDSGFIFTYKGHEERSVEIAREMLPKFGYTADQIERVCELILATRVPQFPPSRLAGILCDADLDYLGRPDFYSTGARLFHEYTTLEMVESEQEWNELQEKFLAAHSYHTNYSRMHREPMKQKHLEQVREIVAGYVD